MTEIQNFYDEISQFLIDFNFYPWMKNKSEFPVFISSNNKILIQIISLADFQLISESNIDNFQEQLLNFRQDFNHVFRIWEDVWLNRRDWITIFIKNKLIGTQSVFARDTQVIEIPKEMAKLFMQKNHLMGFLKGKTYWACIVPEKRHFRGIQSELNFKGDAILAVAVFGKDRLMKDSKFLGDVSAELIQIASEQSVRLVGGISKLIANYVTRHSIQNVMTYSDLEWSDGHACRQIGFVDEKVTPPLFFNFDANGKRKMVSHFCDAKVLNAGNIKSRFKVKQKSPSNLIKCD